MHAERYRQFGKANHEVIAGVTVKHTAPKRIAAFRFRLPTHNEQRAIGLILGSLDDKIELNRQMNRTLEKMAQDIFKSWFIDFDPVRARRGEPMCSPSKRADTQVCPCMTPEILALFPDSFEDSELGEIPKGWKVKLIGNVNSPQCKPTNVL